MVSGSQLRNHVSEQAARCEKDLAACGALEVISVAARHNLEDRVDS